MTTPNANGFVGSSTLDSDAAVIAAARDAAADRSAARQVEAAQFIVEHGADVIDGHDPQMVIRPGFTTPMSGDVFDPTAV